MLNSSQAQNARGREESMPWSVGQTVGNGSFTLRSRLGVGSMGAVFEAHANATGERVALKFALATESANEQASREYRSLESVRHPNIVSAKNLFVDAETPFYTMECIDGVPFDVWVRPSGKLNTQRLRSAMLQLASALRAVHEAGMIHADVKPNNVLITHAGRVVLLDFGYVTSSVDADESSSDESLVYGTPAYMAPEQAAGCRLCPASDAYALGVMLYQALTGRLPFEGSLCATMWARQQRLAPAPSSLCEVPDDLNRLCVALMALKADERPSDDEIVAALALPARCSNHV